jgi:DNA polymerase III sliding clamp (beta) subunit (PCNA family)
MNTETITTTELTAQLPLVVAKSIASMAVLADAKATAPALGLIKVVFDETSLTAIATDRYVAGRAKFTYDGDARGTIYLTTAMAKFITGLKNGDVVNFDLAADGCLTVSNYATGMTDTHYKGNYPAVETIIDGHKPGTTEGQSFTVELIAKLGKLVGIDGKKITVWHLQPGTSERPDRPAPVLATKDEFQVIIQPNLVR